MCKNLNFRIFYTVGGVNVKVKYFKREEKHFDLNT